MMGGPRGTVQQRFERYVFPEPMSGCWLWVGAMTSAGYGLLTVGRKASGKLHQKLAHHVSYELKMGEIPRGLELDHLCRNPCCVNPDHLEAVTHQINMSRGNVPRGESHPNRQKLFCKRGHSYSGDNLYEHQGKRYCKKCQIFYSRWHKRMQRRKL